MAKIALALILVMILSFNSQAVPIKHENLNYEIRTAPIAFFAKWLTLDFTFFIGQNWSLGPSYVKYSSTSPSGILSPSYNGEAYGLHFNYYFNSYNYENWYFSAHGYTEKYDSYPHAYSGVKNVSGTKANIDFGYRAVWTNNMTMMVGAGLEFLNQTVTERPSTGAATELNKNSSRPHLEFKIGYLF